MQLLFILLLELSAVFLQKPQLDQANSHLKVLGDSSIHEWEMEVKDFAVDSDWNELKLKGIQLSMQVEALKSGKEKMDENAYEAMDQANHPEINFKSESIAFIGEDYFSANGILTISGNSRSINLKGKFAQTEEQIVFEGLIPIDMTEYNIEPPTAMMGMMKVDKMVQLDFRLSFSIN